MPVTLRDIARHLNLSHATVSFVLNERHDVAIPDATRQRVFEAARQMGYRPNRVARALVSGRTQMVAISMPMLRHPFYTAVFHSLFEISQQNGYGVLVHQSSRGLSRRAFDWPVDAVIVADSPDLVGRKELPTGLPAICIGTQVDPSVDHVHLDLADGAQIAIRHLLDRGCRRILRVKTATETERPDGRDEAYNLVLQEAGIDRHTLVVREPDAAKVRQAVREYVTSEGKPDGFFCTCDVAALGALRAMADLGYVAPNDFPLVGFDGIDAGEISVPSISAVVSPIEELCRLGFDFLLRRLREPESAIQSSTLYPEFVVRETSRR